MTRQTLLLAPAVLVSVAMALSISRSNPARAADECVSRPGASAPQGSHWYYRVDRSTHEHCWYLGPEGAKVVPTESRRTQPVTQPVTQSVLRLPVPRPAWPGENAYASAVPVVMAARPKAAPDEAAPSFAMRWPSTAAAVGRERVGGNKADLIRETVSASNYAAEGGGASENDDMPAIWPVLEPADHAYTAAQPSRPPVAFLAAVIGGALLSFAVAACFILRGSPAPTPVRPGRAALPRSSFVPKRVG